jgi:hypothetical protein
MIIEGSRWLGTVLLRAHVFLGSLLSSFGYLRFANTED